MKKRFFTSFDGKTPESALPNLCLDLLAHQKNSWPALSAGLADLEHVRIRELYCNGFSVRLQFNPARIVSSGASVDPQSISERPCFLCEKNLPEVQKGILYRQTYLILCNPFPIVTPHYTISHVSHLPQSISGAAGFFLRLAEDLFPDFNVFYNGPRCGASAPDHLHFQAAPAGVLPMEREIQRMHSRQLMKDMDGTSIFKIGNLGRQVLMIEGGSLYSVETALMKIIDRLKTAIPTVDEPMMNLLCSYRDNTWRVILFLRRKHRPDVYFLKDDRRILLSPGLVDMGGLVITPVEKDFAMIDPPLMEEIYREISLETETVQQAVNLL